MDLFGIGDLFYTRRIGGPTLNGASRVDSLQQSGNIVESAAAQAQLINATKISGRTKKGLGIGVFNALESRSTILYRDTAGNECEILAHPLTNYNIFVLSQNLKNNSNVSLLNTNVFRPEIGQVSNVTSAQTLLLTRNKKYTFSFSGQGSVVQSSSSAIFGHNIYAAFERVAGAINYSLEYYEMSDSFDPNDLGYLDRNNLRGTSAEIVWNGYNPKGRFLRRQLGFSTDVQYLYDPQKFAYWSINAGSFGTSCRPAQTSIFFRWERSTISNPGNSAARSTFRPRRASADSTRATIRKSMRSISACTTAFTMPAEWTISMRRSARGSVFRTGCSSSLRPASAVT
jgi:hypothetical protein